MDPGDNIAAAYADLRKRYDNLCARLQIFPCARCGDETPQKNIRECLCKRKYCTACDPIPATQDTDMRLQAQLIRESKRSFPHMFELPRLKCDGCAHDICLLCNGGKCACCARVMCLKNTDTCRAFECANGCGAVICCWEDPANKCLGCNHVYCPPCMYGHTPNRACAPVKCACGHTQYGVDNHYTLHRCHVCMQRGNQYLTCAECPISQHTIIHTVCAMLPLRDYLPMEIIVYIATLSTDDVPQRIDANTIMR